MSDKNYSTQRMSIREARKLIAKLAETDAFRLTKHAKEEMADEVPELILLDLINVLKSPDSEIRDPGELNNDRYSYRLQTNKIMVVVGFPKDGKFIKIITCWRLR